MILKKVKPETEIEEFFRLFPKSSKIPYKIKSDIQGKMISCETKNVAIITFVKSKGLVES